MTAGVIGAGGGIVFPVITDGIIAPNFNGYSTLSAARWSAVGWAFPILITEDMDVDAFVYITGSTVWSGRKIGIYDVDLTGFSLGAELAAVSSLAPAADSEITTTFTAISLTKDTAYWIAAGGGTGTTKVIAQSVSGASPNFNTGSGLPNSVGALAIDLDPATTTTWRQEAALQVSANTPAASGALIGASTTDGITLPLCGLRKA